MPRADTAQVRALLAACWSSDDRRRAVAIQAEPEWGGPDVFDVGGVPTRVVSCGSPLAVREALLDHEQRAGELLVVLTQCSGTELGLDVRARLVKGDVLPLDPYTSILALFGAMVLDPQLVAERWLIDELIALAPAEGWPDRPLGGVLDVDIAWRTWHQARLDLSEIPNGVDDVLALGARPDVGAALAELAPERRARVAERWAGGASGPIPVMVDLLAGGDGGDLIALGLVAQVLGATTDDAALTQLQSVARARLERLLGRDRLDPRSAGMWGASAVAALEGNSVAPALLDLAERVLAGAGAVELAVLSDTLPRGFDERLAILGRALAARDLDGAVNLLAAIRAHRTAQRRPHRVEMAEAAVRLLRRNQSAPQALPSTFAAAVAHYAADGAWVDEARRLLAEGDHVPQLAAAYSGLAEAASAEQASRFRTFAVALAEWSASEPLADPRLVPIESILDEVVTPVAAVAPVLLVVCDGMGLPVAHRLLRDLMREGWAPAGPEDAEGWPVGVAVLPTVTQTSRTSLLAGRRVVGGQAEEREGFASHPGLRNASSPTRPPALFHKAGLVAPSGVALPDDVRRLAADPDQRVLGVVVNSVDDHLARGDQVRVGWDLVSLRPLPWLLDAAAEAGRVVILTADHGHVLHGTGSTARQLSGGGERWRTAPPPAGDGEIEIAGPRVLLGGGRVVLPIDDRLRYGGYKHGYHGGATPEEVLVPIEVLARRLPNGWAHRPISTPTWWTGADVPTLPSPSRTTLQAALFEESAPPPPVPVGRDWVDGLLRAPAFVAQRERARLPRPITDERLRRYLKGIDANGGSIPLAALAARTGEPADTLRMVLTLVQRLLNVDGTEVLAVRADSTVMLNRELAELQFEIDST